jgi:hypothetical protein
MGDTAVEVIDNSVDVVHVQEGDGLGHRFEATDYACRPTPMEAT